MKKTYKSFLGQKYFFTITLFFFLISGCSKITGSKIGNVLSSMDTSSAVIQCPELLVLEETHPLIRLNPERVSIKDDILFIARFRNVVWDCFGEYDEDTSNYIRSRITISVIVEAEPAYEDYINEPFIFEYFIALRGKDNNILTKTKVRVEGNFSPSAKMPMIVSKETIDIDIPSKLIENFYDLKVYLGFQLTPEELSLNRSRVGD